MSYSELIQEAERFLESKDGEAIGGAQIAAYLETMMDDRKIERHPRNVILVYLSRAANRDESSRIVSGGPRGGYSLEVQPEAMVEDQSANSFPSQQPSDTPPKREKTFIHC